jgi:glycosyltransferase involved in cell wall biosynthesis
MRVLLVVKGFDFGGAENHVRELANSLCERGHDVFVIAGRGRQVSLLSEAVIYKRLTMRDLFIPFQITYLWFIIIRHNIQVVHAHQRLPILLSSIAAKVAGIPVIATVHGRTKYDLRYSVSRRVPARFIFVSNQVLQVSAKREEIISRSVIVQNWTTVTPQLVGKRNDSICYISRIDKKHSSVILLILTGVIEPLMARHSGLTFTVIGEGDALEALRTEAENVNLRLNREACFIAGFNPDVRETIRHSGLVIGVGRVAIEALSCGTPLLSVNVKHMGTVISTLSYKEYMRNNFLDVAAGPPSAEGLIERIEEYLNDPRFWQNEACLLQQLISEDFNKNQLLSVIEDIYETAVNTDYEPVVDAAAAIALSVAVTGKSDPLDNSAAAVAL